MLSLSLIWIAATVPALGHHAFVDFDRGRTIEVEGEVTNVIWRNPHIRLSILSAGETWDIEGSSLSILGRTGITESDFRVGQTVRLAGWPVHSGANRLHVNNALIDGQEYVLSSRGRPRWEDTAVGTSHALFAGGSESTDNSLFRVWTTDGDDPHSNTPGFWPDDYPLTDWAREQQARWTPLTGAECEPKGMPTIMEQPYPIGFVDEGDRILLRMEEYDTVRTIHLDGGTAETTEPALLGHSRGRWEDSTLVVETDRIDWAYFDKEGIPQGKNMSIVERFTPSADGSRLEYAMTVTDAEVFSAPVDLERHWVYRPGETVRPYDCTWGN